MQATLADGVAVTHLGAERGNGVVATSALPAGTRLFEEFPLIAMQHGANARTGVEACQQCFRFLGPLEAQVDRLLICRGSQVRITSPLPAVEGVTALPLPVACPGGCDLHFCSEACAGHNWAAHHRLLCPGRRDATASAGSSLKRGRPADAAPLEASLTRLQLDGEGGGASRVAGARAINDGGVAGEMADGGTSASIAATPPAAVVDVSDATPDGAGGSGAGGSGAGGGAAAGGGSAADGLTLETLQAQEADPWQRFVTHANASNEVFLLAAKAAALVLCRVEGLEGAALAEATGLAMAPFVGPLWWEAVATPDDAPDEASFRRTLRDLLNESWTLLASVLGPHTPVGCELFTTPTMYATIVGAFERRNCALQVASPVEEYLLAVDAMDEGHAKAAITLLTTPLLDALDAAYATPCDGMGLYPLQATLNHSCEPNVHLLKEPSEEVDGRVVARLTRDVVAGEELCNAYVDVSLPVRRRRRELREYGFECTCPRCVRETALTCMHACACMCTHAYAYAHAHACMHMRTGACESLPSLMRRRRPSRQVRSVSSEKGSVSSETRRARGRGDRCRGRGEIDAEVEGRSTPRSRGDRRRGRGEIDAEVEGRSMWPPLERRAKRMSDQADVGSSGCRVKRGVTLGRYDRSAPLDRRVAGCRRGGRG